MWDLPPLGAGLAFYEGSCLTVTPRKGKIQRQRQGSPKRVGREEMALEWIALTEPKLPAPRPARSPPRPSQIVSETSKATPTGQHVVVTLERTSTGGTRREAQFTTAAAGAMSAAERAQKKRKRKELFPQQCATDRQAEVKRRRDARWLQQDQETLQQWPALEERLQAARRDGVDCVELLRHRIEKKTIIAAARLGVELEAPVGEDDLWDPWDVRKERILRCARQPGGHLWECALVEEEE